MRTGFLNLYNILEALIESGEWIYSQHPQFEALCCAGSHGAYRDGVNTASSWNPRSRPQRLSTRDSLADLLNILIDVLPELVKARTEIVQSRLPIATTEAAVLWTFAVTGKQVFAVAALLRQGAELVESDLLLPFGEHHARTRCLRDIAQFVFRIYVVIAGIQAPIVFECYSLAAKLMVDAHLRFSAHPHGNRILKTD